MAPPGRAKNGRFEKKSKLKWIENVKASNITRKSQELNVSSDSVRRVCELGVLGEGLWCSFCDRPLSLEFVEDEIINGLASTLAVRCDVCLSLHNVQTCKVSSQKAAHRPRFDVNRKVAMGMIDAGLGHTKLNTFLSAVSLPAVSDSLLKRHEREVGGAMESVAHASCLKAIKLEKRMTRDFESSTSFTSCSPASASTPLDCDAPSSSVTSSPTSGVNPVGCGATTPSTPKSTLTRGSFSVGCTSADFQNVSSSTLMLEDQNATEVSTPTSTPVIRSNILMPNSTENIMNSPPARIRASFDAGWQKRGNQKSYSSRTGHASAIGYFSKKVIGYAVRKTSCRKCKYGVPKDKHDCRKNFSNSAKAMEADMALSLLAKNEDLEKENCVVGVVIGDDDSATIASVRRNVSHIVDKWSDLNHAKKGLSNALYALKGKNKLSTSAIKYLSRCFGYALKQNKDDVDKVRNAIMTCVEHAFDNHEGCGEWCGYRKDPSNYRHKGLPHGKGLQGTELYNTIRSIFQRYANNSERLAPCGSSQANESFNSVVMRKHPKSEFYGDSESIDYRVASAVCQKNEGTSYVLEVNNRLGLSPGRLTEKFRRANDRKRITHSIRKQSFHFKRRRLLLKGTHASKTSANELREGVV